MYIQNMTQQDATYWVKNLDLLPHPEGGYFRQTYKSAHTVAVSHIRADVVDPRHLATAIYFLIERGNFSAFHRLKSDEQWHFYAGDPLIVHMIDTDGSYTNQVIGLDLENGQRPQYTVPAGVWFASEVYANGAFSLVGCTVSFGFEFTDFTLADKRLIDTFPQHTQLIERLTR